ncbi:MAG: hypothetical protein V1859_08605 [archaeon]
MKHHTLRKNLAKKRWHENDISHALSAFSLAKEKKTRFMSFLDKSFAWFTLLVVIVINFVVLFSLIPVYLIMPLNFVALCIFVIGLCFGLLIDIVIKDIEHFTHHHYIIAGLVLPILSVTTLFYTFNLIMPISALFNVKPVHNIALLSALYLISYVAPHVTYKIIEFKERELYGSS